MLGVRCQVSGVRCQVSGVRCQVLGVRKNRKTFIVRCDRQLMAVYIKKMSFPFFPNT
ncbi:Uncharacterized protein dnm_042950 [Desulfonema magnum]|uniref:Uncharacterized protein n=1 Tax=Desulfonema magnum TaxID=45655 RepID=A0A975BMJ5_9BACT|nr:Uncharacterized protein dnm_042950 [Desulfonema magnum]